MTVPEWFPGWMHRLRCAVFGHEPRELFPSVAWCPRCDEVLEVER